MNGAEGDRTLNLRIANAALSQLSYGPGTVKEFYLSRAARQPGLRIVNQLARPRLVKWDTTTRISS